MSSQCAAAAPGARMCQPVCMCVYVCVCAGDVGGGRWGGGGGGGGHSGK